MLAMLLKTMVRSLDSYFQNDQPTLIPHYDILIPHYDISLEILEVTRAPVALVACPPFSSPFSFSSLVLSSLVRIVCGPHELDHSELSPSS